MKDDISVMVPVEELRVWWRKGHEAGVYQTAKAIRELIENLYWPDGREEVMEKLEELEGRVVK